MKSPVYGEKLAIKAPVAVCSSRIVLGNQAELKPINMQVSDRGR